MKRQNELLKKKINKLSYNQKFEIYNILVKSNQQFSENKNGIFFNLKYLNQTTIKSIQAFLNYSEQIQNKIHDNQEDNHIHQPKEDSLHDQYNNYNENNEKKDTLDTEEYTLYNNEEYSTIFHNHELNSKENDHDTITDSITDSITDIITEEDNVEGETEVTEIYNQEVHEDQGEQEEQNENISIVYDIEEDIDINDFNVKESTKNKFNFKNYMNKLHLQSKEMNVKLYNQSKQSISEKSLSNISQQSISTINNKLTGSKSRIYNVCRNIHKSSEY
jgi:hypothetical protein